MRKSRLIRETTPAGRRILAESETLASLRYQDARESERLSALVAPSVAPCLPVSDLSVALADVPDMARGIVVEDRRAVDGKPVVTPSIGAPVDELSGWVARPLSVIAARLVPKTAERIRPIRKPSKSDGKAISAVSGQALIGALAGRNIGQVRSVGRVTRVAAFWECSGFDRNDSLSWAARMTDEHTDLLVDRDLRAAKVLPVSTLLHRGMPCPRVLSTTRELSKGEQRTVSTGKTDAPSSARTYDGD
jgi:hypothetical protein